jgi:hypothetical protein
VGRTPIFNKIWRLKKMMKKKAQAISFNTAPTLILIFVVITLITAAGAVGVASFQDSQTAGGYAYNVSAQGLSGLTNFSVQMPTVGTMLGVGLILVVVIGVFAFFARR